MINCCIIISILLFSIFLFPTGVCTTYYKETEIISRQQSTVIKGVAILLILISHISNTMETVIFTPLGGIGVAMFLFCSGYGLNESFKKKGLSNFWGKKIAHVLIPYAIVITCVLISLHRVAFPDYLLDILGLKTTFWFVAYIIKWYIVFWLSSLLSKNHRIILMLVVALLFFMSLPEIEAEQSLSFIMGVLVSHNICNLRKVAKTKFVKVSIFLLVIGVLALSLKQLPQIRFAANTVFNFVQMLIKLPFALGVIGLCLVSKKVQNSRMLNFTGLISYELFLLQMPFYNQLNGSLLNSLLFILALYPSSWLFFKFNNLVVNLLKLK